MCFPANWHTRVKGAGPRPRTNFCLVARDLYVFGGTENQGEHISHATPSVKSSLIIISEKVQFMICRV